MIPAPLIAEIKEAVCEAYGLRLDDMRSPVRSRDVAHPRQVAMFLSRALTRRSLAQIGSQFGRDHTTVIYAVKAVEQRLMTEAEDAYAARLICAGVALRVAFRADMHREAVR